MAALTVYKVKHVAPTVTYVAAAAGGDTAVNDGRMFLHLKNTNASPRTVTVTQAVKCSDGFLHSVAQVVPATTGDVMFGPFLPQEFNDVNGAIAITYDAVTNLTVAAISLTENGRP